MKYQLTKGSAHEAKKLRSAIAVCDEYTNKGDEIYNKLWAPMRESLDLWSTFGREPFSKEDALEVDEDMDFDELLSDGYIELAK